jgi:hypothetical protein
MKRQTAWHGVSFRAGRAFRDAAAWLPPLTLQCNEPTRAKSRPHVNCLETRQDKTVSCRFIAQPVQVVSVLLGEK